MLGSKRIRMSRANAEACVNRYCRNHVLYADTPAEYLLVTELYRDYIGRDFPVSVAYDQFVKALRKVKPRHVFVNKYNHHIIIGYRLGEAADDDEDPVAVEQSTVV